MYKFETEKQAEQYLLRLLEPYFFTLPQCWLRHNETGQKLRIDFIAKPKKNCDFPYPLIGIECKRGAYTEANQAYNKPLWQALDYTRCTLNDARVKVHAGERLEKVYLWPGLRSKTGNSVWGVNRLIGIGHVGVILEAPAQIKRSSFRLRHRAVRTKPFSTEPQFWMCDERQWSPGRARKNAHKTRHTLGSGVNRR